jgi:hypothetical protein
MRVRILFSRLFTFAGLPETMVLMDRPLGSFGGPVGYVFKLELIIGMLAENVLLSILAMLVVWRWFLLDIVGAWEIIFFLIVAAMMTKRLVVITIIIRVTK